MSPQIALLGAIPLAILLSLLDARRKPWDLRSLWTGIFLLAATAAMAYYWTQFPRLPSITQLLIAAFPLP